MLEYESYSCWSDKSVLLEVNSREDGSVRRAFTGTMIRINNLLSLFYSLFILFSSLPFDIPVCFHSPNRAHYVQKASGKIQTAEGNELFIPISRNVMVKQPHARNVWTRGLRNYICEPDHAGMPAHKHINRNPQWCKQVAALYTTLII